ncbi:MAG: hypothetical protein JXR96_20615 [Deltaproteobacteria bacterium]|nr:hypothetical protein [Deltaproteobacteria bacterium]
MRSALLILLALLPISGCTADRVDAPRSSSHGVSAEALAAADGVFLIRVQGKQLSPGSHPLWLLAVEYAVERVFKGQAPAKPVLSTWIDIEVDWEPKEGDRGLLLVTMSENELADRYQLFPASARNLDRVESSLQAPH